MIRTGSVQTPRGPSGRALVALLAGAFVTAAATTVLFLGMRAVMDIGGACAEGGPYVPVQPCPEGTVIAVPLGIFAWILGGGLLLSGGGAVGGAWSWAGILAWSALFGSLGWNFLEYGVAPPGGGGPEWGWLVPGVVFEAMAIVPLVAFIPMRRAIAVSRGQMTTWDADAVSRALNAAGFSAAPGSAAAPGNAAGDAAGEEPPWTTMAFLPPPGGTGGAGSASPPSDDDLVSGLERLAALHASGALTDAEFATAKDALFRDGREGRP